MRRLSLFALVCGLIALAAWFPPEPPEQPAVLSQSAPRSSQWRSVRAKFLEAHPACAACGGTKQLEVHHIRPFHLYPALELEEGNLITLCKRNGCHFRAHCLDWRAYDPDARKWAARELKRLKARKYE